MRRFYLRFSLALIVLLSVFISVSASAGIALIVSAPPPPREVILPPGGYSGCYVVGGRYYDGYWMPRHQVCEYGPGGRLWVTGYWRCNHYRSYDGICRGWGWIPGHWARHGEYEYGRPWHGGYYHEAYGPPPGYGPPPPPAYGAPGVAVIVGPEHRHWYR